MKLRRENIDLKLASLLSFSGVDVVFGDSVGIGLITTSLLSLLNDKICMGLFLQIAIIGLGA